MDTLEEMRHTGWEVETVQQTGRGSGREDREGRRDTDGETMLTSGQVVEKGEEVGGQEEEDQDSAATS